MNGGTYDTLHERYAKIIKLGYNRNPFTIECGSLSHAKQLRMNLYNFARFLNKIIDTGPGIDYKEWIWAKELKELYNSLIFKCHKNGILEIRVREAMRTIAILDNALNKSEDEKLPTHEKIMDELVDVEIEENAKRYGEGGDGLLNQRKKSSGGYSED